MMKWFTLKSAKGWGIDVIGIQSDENPLSKKIILRIKVNRY